MLDKKSLKSQFSFVAYMRAQNCPILERKEGIPHIVVAGKRWTDERNYARFEGIRIPLPTVLAGKEATFAVTDLHRKSPEEFSLRLLSDCEQLGIPQEEFQEGPCGVDADGIAYIEIALSRMDVLRLTGMSGAALDDAFESVNLGATYDLLASLPRIVAITKDEVQLSWSPAPTTKNVMSFSLILRGEHPLDR